MRNNLINERKKKGRTQEQLANMLEITVRQYKAIEAGTSNSSMPIWRTLSKFLNKTINYLDKIDQVDCTTTERK